MPKEAIHYKDSVRYDSLDRFGRNALKVFSSTWRNPNKFGIKLLEESVGETAQVFDVEVNGKTIRLAKNAEVLGTKIIVAVEMSKRHRKNTRKYFRGIGQDTANMSINDVLAVGSQPFSYSPVICVGDNNFLDNLDISGGICDGILQAANDSKATVPGGETAKLEGIIMPEQADLSGSSSGIIKPKERFCHGGRVEAGNILYGIIVNTPCSNGITSIRKIAERMPHGYFTELPSGELFGEAVLRPTPGFSPIVTALFDAGIPINYMQPITGHGFKKIARSRKNLTYMLDNLPEMPEIFQFIQKQQNIGNKEMAETYNCGLGYAIFTEKEDDRIYSLAKEKGMEIVKIGYVEKGPKRIIANSWGFEFSNEDLVA